MDENKKALNKLKAVRLYTTVQVRVGDWYKFRPALTDRGKRIIERDENLKDLHKKEEFAKLLIELKKKGYA